MSTVIGLYESLSILTREPFLTVAWLIEENCYDGRQPNTTHFDQESVRLRDASWRIECHLCRVGPNEEQPFEVGTKATLNPPPHIWKKVREDGDILLWRFDITQDDFPLSCGNGLYRLPQSGRRGRYDEAGYSVVVNRTALGRVEREKRRVKFLIWQE